MNGFLKIKRDDLSISSEISYISAFTTCNADAFMRKNDKLSFGEAKIKKIIYLTCNDELIKVKVMGDDPLSFHILKESLFEKYGSPHESKQPIKYSEHEFSGIESHYWHGSKTDIRISYEHKTLSELIEDARFKILGSYRMTLSFEAESFATMIEQLRQEAFKRNIKNASKDF